METFITSTGRRYAVDGDKVRFPALRTEHVGQVASMGATQPVVAPTRTPGAPSYLRDVALPMQDVLELALNYLRDARVRSLQNAEGDELADLLGL